MCALAGAISPRPSGGPGLSWKCSADGRSGTLWDVGISSVAAPLGE